MIQLQTEVREGRIETAAPTVFAFPQIDSRNEWLTWPVFGGVLGAFTRTADGTWERVALRDVEAIHQGFQEPGLERLYARDLPHGTRRRLQRRIRAAVDLPDGTDVLLYAAWDHRGACDISHPAMKAQFRKMLTAYRRVPLDGIAWHEPIKMGYNQGHALGPFYLDRYRQEYGRELVEELVLLDEDDPRGRHVVVRLAHGQLIGRIVQELIDMMCDTARELWGENVFIGNQCMWQGGGSITDLRANGGDYFALHRNMSACLRQHRLGGLTAHILLHGRPGRLHAQTPFLQPLLLDVDGLGPWRNAGAGLILQPCHGNVARELELYGVW